MLVSSKISLSAVISVRIGAICTVFIVSTLPDTVDGAWLVVALDDIIYL
jgi:hypothetical protein